MIESITIIGGRGKDGDPEPVERIDLQMGSVASIVGPTGSGKTTFINDIELFADGDTPSMRRVLINGERPPRDIATTRPRTPSRSSPSTPRSSPTCRSASSCTYTPACGSPRPTTAKG